MTQIGGPSQSFIDIGDEATPPFAVLPVPEELFARRAARLRVLASASEIGGYLDFVGRLVQLQHDIQAGLPAPALPGAEQLEQARSGAMPPLGSVEFKLDGAFKMTLDRVLSDILNESKAWPAAARDAAAKVEAFGDDALSDALDAIVNDNVPVDEIAAHVLIAAAAEVHYARAAALLDASALQPVADGVCPACGAPPMASAVVSWPRAQNSRFCMCSRCATQWNVVRVKCTRCGSTGGIGYVGLDGGIGGKDAIKGETCEACRGYVKIFYAANDPALDPMADDVASLGLDMKLAEAGWRRLGRNCFLMGYGNRPAQNVAAVNTGTVHGHE